jgi:Domain of unknown function (DUF4224)
MLLFLTPNELIELTGYRQPSKQVAYLRSAGIPFYANAHGAPNVARAVIEGSAVQPAKKTWSPNVLSIS